MVAHPCKMGAWKENYAAIALRDNPNDTEELTYLQEQERKAMAGDRRAVLSIVSGLRESLLNSMGQKP